MTAATVHRPVDDAGLDHHQRLVRLARTLECSVLPRLMQFVSGTGGTGGVSARELHAFVDAVRSGAEADMRGMVEQAMRAGTSVETVFEDWLAGAARQFGRLWEDDLCDLASVTLATGRLQSLMHQVAAPLRDAGLPKTRAARRILLAQAPDEQHGFGLAMVAQYFRRDGWSVLGASGSAIADPASRIASEGVEIVGFSVGSESRLPWLERTIERVRSVTARAPVTILVGGPIFLLRPQWAEDVGADLMVAEGRQAPILAQSLLAGRRSKV